MPDIRDIAVPSDREHREKGTGHTRRIDPWPTSGIDPDVPKQKRSLDARQDSPTAFWPKVVSHGHTSCDPAGYGAVDPRCRGGVDPLVGFDASCSCSSSLCPRAEECDTMLILRLVCHVRRDAGRRGHGRGSNRPYWCRGDGISSYVQHVSRTGACVLCAQGGPRGFRSRRG